MQHAYSPIRVFLADDSALSLHRVAEMLTGEGLAISGRADTPDSAVSGILATQPDLVVLDVQFEKGTGMQVLQSVRKITQDIPFVIFSNHADPAYRAHYLAAGAACFLDKHTEFYQLADTVARLVRPRLMDRPVSFS